MNKVHNKNCLMLNLNFRNWYIFVNKLIQEEDVIEKEYQSHITILYGINYYHSLDYIKMFLPPAKSIQCNFTKLNLFKNEEHDVLHFEIESDLLKSINSKIREKTDYESTFPDYKPHCTVAYLRHGTGDKYLQATFKPFVKFANYYTYSTTEGVVEISQ